jgi:hypothetical protein
MLRKKEPRWGLAAPNRICAQGVILLEPARLTSQTDRDGTNGVVLQMGVPLGGWGLTMPEHLADEVEAVAA